MVVDEENDGDDRMTTKGLVDFDDNDCDENDCSVCVCKVVGRKDEEMWRGKKKGGRGPFYIYIIYKMMITCVIGENDKLSIVFKRWLKRKKFEGLVSLFPPSSSCCCFFCCHLLLLLLLFDRVKDGLM